jgi:hypothetical protein
LGEPLIHYKKGGRVMTKTEVTLAIVEGHLNALKRIIPSMVNEETNQETRRFVKGVLLNMADEEAELYHSLTSAERAAVQAQLQIDDSGALALGVETVDFARVNELLGFPFVSKSFMYFPLISAQFLQLFSSYESGYLPSQSWLPALSIHQCTAFADDELCAA